MKTVSVFVYNFSPNIQKEKSEREKETEKNADIETL